MRMFDPNKPPEKNWPAPGNRSAKKSGAPSRPRLVTGQEKFVRLNESVDANAPPDLAFNSKDLLRRNLARERLHQKMDVDLPARTQSGRGRDYWMGLLIGNFVLGGLYMFLPQNVVTFLFIAGGMAFYSVGFTWLMFSVADDY